MKNNKSERKRGRPKKQRPAPGSDLSDCTSIRDVSILTGISRRDIDTCLLYLTIPKEEFEALVESDNPPTVSQMRLLARRRAGKRTEYVRRCPHCGKPLKIEDVR